MNNTNRARVARKRAQRLGLTLIQRGVVFTLRDGHDVTLAVGPLGVVEAYLLQRAQPKRPGPPPSTSAPESWRRDIDWRWRLAAGVR